MSFLLPKMDPPKSTVPAAPRYTDAEVGEAAAEQRRKLYQDGLGRRGTLGGGLDVMGLYSTSQAKVLGIA